MTTFAAEGVASTSENFDPDDLPFPDLGTPAADVRRARAWDERRERNPDPDPLDPQERPFGFEFFSGYYEEEYPQLAAWLDDLAPSVSGHREWGPVSQRDLKYLYELDRHSETAIERVLYRWEDAEDHERQSFDFNDAFADAIAGEISLERLEDGVVPDRFEDAQKAEPWDRGLICIGKELDRRPDFWAKLRSLGPTPPLLAEANAILRGQARPVLRSPEEVPRHRQRLTTPRTSAPHMRSGRARRLACNHHTSGSRRSGSGSRAGPDDADGDPDPPGVSAPPPGRETAERLVLIGGRR
jgi:hypothetical protein